MPKEVVTVPFKDNEFLNGPFKYDEKLYRATYDLSITTNKKISGTNANRRRQRRRKSRLLLQEYTECSSVHGVQYLGDHPMKVSGFEKIVWSCVMITSFVCACFAMVSAGLSLMVNKFWIRYENNPTRTHVKTFHYPTFLSELPAITVCPFAQSTLQTRQRLLKQLKLPREMDPEDAMYLLKYGADIADPAVSNDERIYRNLQILLTENNLKLVDFLKLLRPCSDLVKSCWWHGKEVNCSRVFRLSYSGRGLCCSHNYQLEDYIKLGRRPKPQHTSQFGVHSGLTLVFSRNLFVPDDVSEEIERISSNSIGLLVFSHHSMDYPGDGFPIYILQAGQELQLAVQPSSITKPADFSIRNKNGEMTPMCTTTTQGKLAFFPEYRYSNCYANCRIEAAIGFCGCVPYYYDAITRNFTIRACQLEDFPCLKSHIKQIRIVKDVEGENFSCSCRNPCVDQTYRVKPNICSLKAARFSTSQIYRNVTGDQAILRAYLHSDIFATWETVPAADEIYLLASVGGIFSLFLGCSFLSAVEIVYFLVLLCSRRSGKK